MKYLFVLFICLSAAFPCFSTEWYVGDSRTYTLPSQIKNLVADGDTVYIDGGTYANDAVKWNKKDLKLIGLGTGSNRTVLQYSGDIANGKGIFVFETPGTCDNAFVYNIVFDGAQVSDANGANGAGIRFQANNLTVSNCKFMNCQNGILEGNGSVTTSNVTIENCEFENNGYQLQNNPNYSGYEHHIYISASADSLFVTNCYFHHPRGQANSIKTRAQRSFILYNLIDEDTGYGSWELNIAQGGLNIVMGNIIIQGPSGANHGIVGYDATTNALEDFYFVNNTVINRFAGNIKYFNIAPASGINTFKMYNNIFASIPGASNTMFTGNIPGVLDSSHNTTTADYLSFGFTNPATDDYSLTASATAAIDHGTDAGTTNTSYSLTPSFSYLSPDIPPVPRTTSGSAIDIGAYEFTGALPITTTRLTSTVINRDVRLQWLSSDVNIVRFEVQRAVSNNDFRSAGSIAAHPQSPSYTFTDAQTLSHVPGGATVFYRLKIFGSDGSFKYSNVAAVNTGTPTVSFTAFPNPSTGNGTIKVNAADACTATVSITGTNGLQVKASRVYELSRGENQVHLQDFQSLPAGVYVLTVTCRGTVFTEKITRL